MEISTHDDEDTLAVTTMFEEEEAYRGVAFPDDFTSNPFTTSFKPEKKNPFRIVDDDEFVDDDDDVKLDLIIPEQEVGLSWLPLVGRVVALVQAVSTFLTENEIAFSNARPSEFVGYLFKETSYAFFQIVFYLRAEDEKPALKITRLTGDAFLTTDLYKDLREFLITEDLVCAENDPWGIDLEDLEYLDGSLSEDEDIDEEEPQMEISKYLKLKYDTNMIHFWLHDLLENEYYDQTLNTMMMLAHNSENLENVQLLLEHSDGKLFEGITKVMEDSNQSFPMVRSCAKTVQNIMSNSDANISWDLVKTMCDALLFWSEDSESKEFSYNQPIRNSPEIQTTLASALNDFVEKFNGKKVEEAPEELKYSIDEVQMWLKDERSICHPEARDNLEYFVKNVTPILGY